MENTLVYTKIKDATEHVFNLVKEGMDINDAVIEATKDMNKEMTQRVIEEVNVKSYMKILESEGNKARPFPLADPKVIFQKEAKATLQKVASFVKQGKGSFKDLKDLSAGSKQEYFESMEKGVMTGAEKILGTVRSGVTDVMRVLEDKIYKPYVWALEDKVKGVKKELKKHKLKLQHQKILYHMLYKDDILKDVDKDKIISIYKNLVKIAPHVAAQKETALSIMRQLATQSDMVIDPMLLKIILEAESHLDEDKRWKNKNS